MFRDFIPLAAAKASHLYAVKVNRNKGDPCPVPKGKVLGSEMSNNVRRFQLPLPPYFAPAVLCTQCSCSCTYSQPSDFNPDPEGSG